ncbi:MAG: TRAP transporter substrate-binding protein DctP [Polyangiaceae bacterium]
MIRKLTSACLVAAALVAAAGPLGAETEIKIGTLAPKSSPWGKVFQTWQDSISEQSGGNMKLTFFWNGSQGDEAAMVDKMKTGSQLDGAAITAVGLSKIWKPILALQMPGVFQTWAKLDAARDSIKDDTKSNFEKGGFIYLGGGDIGMAHVMSKGYAVNSPDDVKGRKPYMWSDDSIAPVLWSQIGGVTPVPLKIPEVLPNLNSGAIDLVNAPALAAQQLQWSSKLDNINSSVSGLGIGALVLKKATADGLPDDQKKLLLDTGAVIASALTDRIRNADAAAYTSLKSSMTVTDPSEDSKTKWKDIFKATREKLKQGTFDSALVTKIEGFSG